MSNDFVLVGPPADPAQIREAPDAPDALQRIARAQVPFASRGDDSGTHRAELRLWAAAELDPAAASGSWYRELGSGMGATLNAAVAMDAYTLVDRATWTVFANRQQTEILFEGDPRLANPYSVLLVDPARHPHVKVDAARRFADWLTSPEGQAGIAGYRLNGRQLFTPASPQ
jgi:tungstate transport system substrate-binding protein